MLCWNEVLKLHVQLIETTIRKLKAGIKKSVKVMNIKKAKVKPIAMTLTREDKGEGWNIYLPASQLKLWYPKYCLTFFWEYIAEELLTC